MNKRLVGLLLLPILFVAHDSFAGSLNNFFKSTIKILHNLVHRKKKPSAIVNPYQFDVVAVSKEYVLSTEPIDVIFVCHPKDVRTLDMAIDGIRKNGKNIRRIVVVSAQRLTDQAEWFDEAFYPFSKASVALEIFRGNEGAAHAFCIAERSRIGWIYQQLLKLYAAFVIPGISSNLLTIDADTVFLQAVEFIDSNGKALFNPGFEYYRPYFEHAARLLPGLKKLYSEYSGISHHMLFQRPILEDLFHLIQATHQTDAWRALCRCIDSKELFKSAFSEYEIYFNFAFARTELVKLRPLRWKNMKFDEQNIRECDSNGYDYVSCHTFCG